MIEIIKRNGVTETWDKDQYDDYMYDGKCFVIIKKDQWVGIYNMDCVSSITVGD